VAVVVSPTFLIHVYKDEQYGIPLLQQIRSLYPSATIACIGDGVDPPELRSIAQQVGAYYIAGDRLKLAKHGTRWSKRMFRIALELEADPLIKMDADAWLWRRFNHFPDADLAGTLTCYLRQRLHLVRGGAMMFSRNAIEQILDSGMLDDQEYLDCTRYAYYRYAEWLLEGEERSDELLYSENCTVASIAAKLGLKQVDWAEVHACFREPIPENVNLQWAATHPHRPNYADTQ